MIHRLLLLLLISFSIPVRIPVIDVAIYWIILAVIILVWMLCILSGRVVLLVDKYIALIAMLAMLIVTSAVVNFNVQAAKNSIMFVMMALLPLIIYSVKSIKIDHIVQTFLATAVFQSILGFVFVITPYVTSTDIVVSFVFHEIAPIVKGADELKDLIESAASNPQLNWTVNNGAMMRNIGSFLSPIVTAVYLSLAVIVAFFVYKKNSSKVMLLVLLVLWLGLLSTMTRGALLSFVFSLFVFFIARPTKEIARLILLGLLLGVAIIVLMPSYVDRLFGDTSASMSSIVYRLEFLRNGINSAVNAGFFGVGFGGYEKAFATIRFNEYPHNQYVELWAECGLISMFVYILLLGVVLADGYYLSRNRHCGVVKDKCMQGNVLMLIALFFITYSMFEDILGTPVLVSTFLLLTGAFRKLKV